MSFNNSSSSSTERSSQTYAPYIQEAQQDATGAAWNMANNFLRASPFARAAMSADQLRGMDMARVSAKDAFLSGGNLLTPRAEDANMLLNIPALTANRTPAMARAAQTAMPFQGRAAQAAMPFGGRAAQAAMPFQGQAAQAAMPFQGRAAQSAMADQGQAAQAASAAQGRAAQVNAQNTQELLNPYLDNVLGSTLDNSRREYMNADAGLQARYAAGQALGGSGEALARGQAARGYAQDTGQLTAKVKAEGYDSAQRMALANAQLRQQMETQNLNAAQQTGLANAEMRQQMEMRNLNAADQTRLSNTQLRQQMGLQNLDAQRQTELANAQFRQQMGIQNMDGARQTELANAQMRQQMGIQNLDAQRQTELANAQLRQQMGIQNLDGRRQAELANAQFRQQAELSNRDAQNSMSAQNLDAWLKAPQINSQLLDANQRRQLQAAQAIMAGGNQQQAFVQSVYDEPFRKLAMLQGTIPQVFDNNRVTNKETESSSSGFDLGSIFTGAANLMKASDEGLKTNKEKIGKDPHTGLLMWAYDYKSDVEKSKKTGEPMPAKRVGPMAQEVEQKYPGSTKKIDGKMMIDMGLLSKMLAKNGK
jgi:hypothetical protein